MSKKKKGLAPELRFPQFSSDAEWTFEPFKKLYELQTTNSLSRDKLNYQHGAVKNIHYGDIHTKFSTLFDLSKETVPFVNETEPLEKIKPESYCQETDVVFADASEDMDDIGKSIEIVNLNNEKLISGLHTLLARQRKNKLVKGFAGYLFKSAPLRRQIQKEAQGAKVLGISAGRISTINVPYPESKHEQQKITDCLASIDELITLHTQKLNALKDHKKGLMKQLFPVEGETLPKLRFPEFKEKGDWVVTTLGGIGSISSGGTPSRAAPEYWDGNIPWVSTTLINFNEIKETNEFITQEGLENSSAKVFPPDTILMAMYGQGKTRGKVAKLGIESAINQACAAITLDKEMSTDFVFQNLAGRYDEIRKISNPGGQENLSAGLITNISFKHPDIDSGEQEKIAEFLTSLDEIIFSLTEKIESLIVHKKGLFQKLFPVMDEIS